MPTDLERTVKRQTLLVGLAHPDDELGMAGTILSQRARGDHVFDGAIRRGHEPGIRAQLATAAEAPQRALDHRPVVTLQQRTNPLGREEEAIHQLAQLFSDRVL